MQMDVATMSERKETARKDARTAGKTALNETNQRNNEVVAIATAYENLAAALENLAATFERKGAFLRKLSAAIDAAIKQSVEEMTHEIDAAIKKELSEPEIAAAIKKVAERRKTNGKKQGGAA